MRRRARARTISGIVAALAIALVGLNTFAQEPQPNSPASESKPKPAAKASPGAGGLLGGFTIGQQNSKEPTKINSDQMNVDQKAKTVQFTSHVVANQGADQLTSKVLKVLYVDENFSQIDKMWADGDVRVSQGNRWVTADHLLVDELKHLAIFTGNPVAHDGQDQITGSRMIVHMDTNKSEVEDPKLVIFPRNSQNEDNTSSAEQP
jgi:lipopolysaccharide export system protein LptA